jgi:hypothetical protein
MSITLKRPMFRRGGSINTGIMSGLVDRTNYSNGGLDIDRIREQARAIESVRDEISPIPTTRLPFGTVGLALASGIDPIQALTMGYDKFVKADDIRRAQLAKRKRGSTDIALQTELKRLEQKPQAITLTDSEVKKLGLPEGSIVQKKTDGTLNVVSKPDSSTLKKRADLKSTIGLLNKVEENYIGLNKPVGGAFGIGFDIDRFKGQIGRFTGSKAGEKYAELLSDIDKTTTFLTQAISGAQVSEQEAERIRRLIPQITDTEVVFEAKLKSLRNYLGEATKNYGGDIEALMKAGVSAKEFYKEPESEVENLEIGDDGIYDLTKG